MENVTKFLPRLNINLNFASLQLPLLACILRCLYGVTLSQESPLCLCGRHCIDMIPKQTLLTQAGDYATDCVMPHKKDRQNEGLSCDNEGVHCHLVKSKNYIQLPKEFNWSCGPKASTFISFPLAAFRYSS